MWAIAAHFHVPSPIVNGVQHSVHVLFSVCLRCGCNDLLRGWIGLAQIILSLLQGRVGLRCGCGCLLLIGLELPLCRG